MLINTCKAQQGWLTALCLDPSVDRPAQTCWVGLTKEAGTEQRLQFAHSHCQVSGKLLVMIPGELLPSLLGFWVCLVCRTHHGMQSKWWCLRQYKGSYSMGQECTAHTGKGPQRWR